MRLLSMFGNKIRFNFCLKRSRWLYYCIFFSSLISHTGNVFAREKNAYHGTSQDSSKSIYIQTVLSKKSIYTGEAFTVKYLLYYSIPVIDPQTPLSFNFKDAYVEEYPNQEQVGTEIINGREYHVFTIKKILLIANHTGSFIIPSISLKLKINAKPDPDDFFGQERTIIKKYSSAQKSITILPLPDPTDKIDFSGAVGDFKITARFNKTQKSGNLLSVVLNITGKGNLKSARFNPLKLPSGIDIFDEKNSETHQLTEDALIVNHVYEFNLAANYRGKYDLSQLISFSYFNPAASKYIKFSPQSYLWTVNSGPHAPKQIPAINKSSINGSANTLYSAKTLGQHGGGGLFYKTTAFYLLLAFSGLIFFGGMVYRNFETFRLANTSYYNYNSAKKRAHKKLKKIQSSAKNTEADILSQSLIIIFQEYLLDKDISPATGFSMRNLVLNMQEKQIPENIRQQSEAFLNRQHIVRFSALKQWDNSNEDDCSTLLKIINSIDNYLHDKASSPFPVNN